MRLIYIHSVTLTEPATPGHFIYDDPVGPGKVLIVKNLSVTYPGFKTSHTGEFFVVDSSRNIYIYEGAPKRTGGKCSWTGDLAIGESDKVGCRLPESGAAAVIDFYIIGELWDIEDWRKYGEISK